MCSYSSSWVEPVKLQIGLLALGFVSLHVAFEVLCFGSKVEVWASLLRAVAGNE